MNPLKLFLAAFLVLSLGPAAAAAQESYISGPGAADRAVNAILEKVGRTPQVFRIAIEPSKVTLRVQGEQRADHIDQWSLERVRIWKFERERVSGPAPVQPDGIVGEVETGAFPLSAIPLEIAAEVADSAIDYAGLEDSAEATSIVIERRLSILPRPSYGDIRWTISVRSPRESATVTADADGRIIGGDLSQTQRARRLDLLRDDWPLPQAQEQLAVVLGPHDVVHRIYFYESYISIDADHPTDPNLETGYSWDLGGVKRGIGDTPNLLRTHGLGSQLPFAFSEVDFTILPQLKQEARTRLAMPDAALTVMSAEKPTTGVGKPQLQWKLEFKDSSGDVGVVTADSAGAILNVVLPESRRPAGPWLGPETIRTTLDRIAQAFGPDARYIEISLDDKKGRVVVEDPQQPGVAAQFIVDPEDIFRFGSPFERFTPERAFAMADATLLDPPRVQQLFARATQLIGLPNGQVHRFTLSRGFMIESQRGLLVVEIRVATPNQSRGGRVNFEVDGAELEVVGP